MTLTEHIKKILFCFSLCLSTCLFGSVSAQEEQVSKGEILFQADKSLSEEQIIKQFGKPGKLEVVSKPWNIYKFIFEDKNNNERALVSDYSTIKGIKYVQYNHRVSLRTSLPNDTVFPTQWALQNTGQNGGVPNADIQASLAWDSTTGGLTKQNDSIIVAVVDDGFELSHPDLNFWKNYGEIPNNSIDDDNNGYVDDFDGWSLYTNTGVITAKKHGTHVTGIIAAKGNNTTGVSGINWNLKVMPVQGSSTTESTVIAAYSYVFEQRKLYNETNGAKGAFIVATNSSFGVDNGNPLSYPLWCGIYDSLGKIGILNACATANASWDIDATGDIPTACPSDYMVSVTNTTNADKKSTAAGYGAETIDLGAPGTQINSTVLGGSYGYDTGTSMATPHVTGSIALMYAAACSQLIDDYKNYPDSVAKLMKTFLLAATDPIADLSGKTVSGGRLNVYKAIQEVSNYCQTISIRREIPATNELSLFSIFPNPSSGNISITGNLLLTKESALVFTNMLGQGAKAINIASPTLKTFETKVDISGIASGIYFVRLKQEDKFSNVIKLVVR